VVIIAYTILYSLGQLVLDVSHNKSLIDLRCGWNQLISLDLSNNNELRVLDCRKNLIHDISSLISLNNLISANVTNNNLDYGDWADIQALINLLGAPVFSGHWLQSGFAYSPQNYFDPYEDGNINTTEHFPDPNFKAYVEEYMGVDAGGEFTAIEAAVMTKHFNCEEKDIYDLTGIEYFTNLQTFSCLGNELTKLDLSYNTALTHLNCIGNHLTELNISSNTALTDLLCGNNQLTELDLSDNTSLKKLQCQVNQIHDITCLVSLNNITSVNVINNNLDNFDWDDIQFLVNRLGDPVFHDDVLQSGFAYSPQNNFDIYDFMNTNINTIEIFPDPNFKHRVERYMGVMRGKKFTAAEAAIKIKHFDCDVTSIRDLTGIEYFMNLQSLSCHGNLLTKMDLSVNTALRFLDCSRNKLTKLDVSSNTVLTELVCYNTQLTELNLSANTALEKLSCHSNQLTELDTSANPVLSLLNCRANKLSALDISENTSLCCLECMDNELTKLNVLSNTALTDLSCVRNKLSKLDVSSNSSLSSLYCSGNLLTELDISSNPALTTLSFGMNQLTEVDLSANKSLSSLYCFGNLLIELDVSDNSSLINLSCGSNLLTKLNLSANTDLITLNCNDNQLTELDISANSAVTKLQCQDNQIQDISSFVSLSNLVAVNVMNNNLDCDDWPDVQSLIDQLGYAVSQYGTLLSGLLYSPQNGINPYEDTTSVKDWMLHN
jgi:Leucine-rich repeat (LRR) protein